MPRPTKLSVHRHRGKNRQRGKNRHKNRPPRACRCKRGSDTGWFRFGIRKRGGPELAGNNSLGQTNKESKNPLTIDSCALSEKAVEVRELEGDDLVVTCQLARDSSSAITSHTLIDYGATGFVFMDQDFARRHQCPLIPLKKPCALEVIDGRPIASCMITHLARTKLQIRHHVEDAFFFVTRLGHYPLVLGIPWILHHNVSI